MPETQEPARAARIATPLPAQPTAADIRALYPGNPYVGYQAPRFAMVLNLLRKYVGAESRILDVGRTMLTDMIESVYHRPVDSIGFDPDSTLASGARQFQFNLNDAQHPEEWRNDLPAYDVILMAEVIEHLHTSPTLVLGFLQSLLKPGGVLIVQTPNGVAIGRRLSILFGRQPFELIREDPTNPGHFREYTLAELERYGRRVGMRILESIHTHTIDLRYKFANLQQPSQGRDAVRNRGLLFRLHDLGVTNFIYRHLPRNCRTGLTIVYQRPA
jgi:SAM-dependent methyltransferase